MFTNDTGANNTASGSYAMRYNSTGSQNVAIGSLALWSNTTASNNVAMGSNAGKYNTTGAQNTFIGNNASEGITGAKLTGNNNTVVGNEAGRLLQGAATNNTLIGATSGDSITTGTANTALGGSALTGVNTGINNVGLGEGAGYNITSGNSNIIIGKDITAASATADNQLNIGGWIVGATGQITKPYQPAFSVTVAAEQTNIATGTDVTVVWGTEVFDVGSNFASNTFTAPVTGKYQLSVTLRLNNVDSASPYYIVSFFSSNRSYRFIYDSTVFAADADYWATSLSALVDMDANDTVYVGINQGGGTVQTDVENNATYQSFTGYLAC